mmetsp:Transcript_23274/g.43742  ORF Transcript_23274/g.43742 Transcript_23274/m.43742 type:complete len:82 (+) Transcript_23274:554-799(+)
MDRKAVCTACGPMADNFAECPSLSLAATAPLSFDMSPVAEAMSMLGAACACSDAVRSCGTGPLNDGARNAAPDRTAANIFN